jgi:serine/threonine protein kinase
MIVRLFDLRERGKDVVLLMEYVAPASGCTTLQDFIVRKQDYSDRLLGALAVQFCVGMEHALACGMAAHRDVKPANLLWGSGPWLKIADFGLALAVSQYPAVIDGSPKRPSHYKPLAFLHPPAGDWLWLNPPGVFFLDVANYSDELQRDLGRRPSPEGNGSANDYRAAPVIGSFF